MSTKSGAIPDVRGIVFRVHKMAWVSALFGYFWVGGGVLGHVVLPLVARGAKDEQDRIRRCQRATRQALRHYHRLVERFGLGACDYAAYQAALPEGPCVVVANHPSLLDITAFLAADRDTCAVVKGELFRGRSVGPLLRYCGHVDAGEGTALDGAAVVKTALERLEQGFTIVVFPEGTRSPEHGMHPLKRGAFELAVRAGVPLLPVFVSCVPPLLSKERPFWRTPSAPFRLQLEPLPPMEGRALGGSGVDPQEALRERARELRKLVQRLLRARVEQRASEAQARGSSTLEECGPEVTSPSARSASAGRSKWNEI